MSVTHRVLYVGIGGTGVHVGKEFELALRRDLCGPDGKSLIRRGGAFKSLKPYQLPDYIQSLYFDFDDDAEQILQKGTDLNVDLLRKNSTVIKSIHANGATSYRVAAEMLRADKETSQLTKNWLPEKSNEPQVAPLSDGAGQYPTVGRAALTLSLKRSGNELKAEIDKAISRLVLAGGMLQAMKNPADKPKVLCYVGFSIAGGTGTGIFYDVIHIMENRLKNILDNVEIKIFPLALMPSAFIENWKPNNISAGKANAAIALKDIAQLVEHLQKDDQPGDFKVSYPQPFGEINMTPASIPTAFIFSKPASVKQTDMYKSMASFIISQITTGENNSDATTNKTLDNKNIEMSIFSKIINQTNITGEVNKYGPGLRPLSPAISGSLSIPIENIADLISRKLIIESIKESENSTSIQSQNNAKEMGEVLKNMGVGFVVDPVPNKPQQLVDEEENIVQSRGKELTKNISYYKTQLYRWVNSFDNHARKEITDAEMDWNQEIIRLLALMPLKQVMRVFQGSNYAQDSHSKEGVIGKLSQFGSQINKSSSLPDAPKIKGPKSLQSGSNSRIKTEYLKQSLPEWYKKEFRIKWQDAWVLQRAKWQNIVDTINDSFQILNSGIDGFIRGTEEDWDTYKSRLTRKSELVSGFLPLSSGNLDTLKEDLLRSLINTPTDGQTPSAYEVLDKILPNNIWQEAWKKFVKKSSEDINEATQELLGYVKIELKNKILDELQITATDGSSLLPNLKNLLIRASRSGSTTSADQIKLLDSELGRMIPLDALPDEGQGKPLTEIWINYPLSEQDKQVEQYLIDKITSDWPNQDEIKDKITCYPVGGDTIFVSIYNFANGLLNLHEPRQLFKEMYELKNKPEGRELLWRQRLSKEGVYNLASERDYIRAIQYFLVAAWNDNIIIEDGTSIHDARNVVINLPNNNNQIKLELKKFKTFSTISDLPDAFKNFWINMSLEDSANWDQLLSVMPNGAEHGDLVDNKPISRVFADIVSDSNIEEIKNLKEIVNSKDQNQAPGVKEKAKLKLDFWEIYLPKALNTTIGAGVYDKLIQLQKELGE
jgi:hypothetical protein